MPHARRDAQVTHDGLPFRTMRSYSASRIKGMHCGVGHFVCDGIREMRVPVAHKGLGVETNGHMSAVNPELTGGSTAQIKKNLWGTGCGSAGSFDIKRACAPANSVARFRVKIHVMFWFRAGFRGIFVKRSIDRNILCPVVFFGV